MKGVEVVIVIVFSMLVGASVVKEADLEVQGICDSIRSDLEQKMGREFEEFTALQYFSQIVAGTNYFVKIRIGKDEFVHVRVFQPLEYVGTAAELHSVQTGKSEDDELEYM